MKKLVLIFSIYLFSSSISAQETTTNKSTTETTPKNEFGMNLFSIMAPAPFHGYSSVNVLNPYYLVNYNLFSGIYYKRYSGKNGLRLSFDYFQKSVMENESYDENNLPITNSYNGIKFDGQIKIGYERVFGNKRLKGFVFSDLVFNYGKYFGTLLYNSNTWFGSLTKTNYFFENFQYGVAFGGGLKYQLNKRLIFTYEFSGSCALSFTQDLYAYDSYKRLNLFVNINPIRQLGFAFMF